jgi:MFS family permease
MNFSSLSASDKRVLIAGLVVAIVALISFVDPSGSWGGIMILSLLGGLGAAFVAAQSQLMPSMKLPATKGLSILVLGAVAAGGTAIAMLSYIGYISRNLTDVYVILMVIGLVAALFVAWTGWVAYQGERGVAPAAAASAPAAPTAPTAPATPPPSDAPPPAAPPPAAPPPAAEA